MGFIGFVTSDVKEACKTVGGREVRVSDCLPEGAAARIGIPVAAIAFALAVIAGTVALAAFWVGEVPSIAHAVLDVAPGTLGAAVLVGIVAGGWAVVALAGISYAITVIGVAARALMEQAGE